MTRRSIDWKVVGLLGFLMLAVALAASWRRPGTNRDAVAAQRERAHESRERVADEGAQRARSPQMTELRLRGRITDTSGQPITDAEVTLSGELEAASSARSRGAGEFAVAVPELGEWRLAVEAKGYLSWTDTITIPNAGADWMEISLVAPGTVRGRVEGPVESRSAFQVVAESAEEDSGTIVSTAMGADGRFELANLRPDTYQLTLRNQNFQLAAQTSVVVTPGAQLEVTLSAPQSGTIEVRNELPADAPWPRNAVLVLSQRASGQMQRLPVDVAANGAFVLDGVPEGTYDLTMEVPGFGNPSPRMAQVEAYRRTLVSFEWPHAGLRGHVELGGEPLAGASVILVPLVERAEVGTALDSVAERAVTSGANGDFSFAGIAQGRYVVVARDDERGEASAEVTIADGVWQETELRLQSGSFVTVQVRSNGSPAQGASVFALRSPHGESSWSAQTDDQGTATVGPLTPGSYDLIAQWAAPDALSQANEKLMVEAGGEPRSVMLALHDSAPSAASATE